MSDSSFWQKLADKFRALPREYVVLRAEKYVLLSEKDNAKWRMLGKIGPRAEFEVLAKRGARRLAKNPTPDLLDLWIETVSQRIPDSHDQKVFGSEKFYNTELPRSISYTVYNLPRRSADLCKVLESAAIQREFDDSLIEKQKPTPLVPEAPAPPTLAEQIKTLRLECNWTIEVLARKTGFDEKTVKRHLSGSAMPRLGNLAIYQQAFSKALGRQILIEKTPPKRPLNAR